MKTLMVWLAAAAMAAGCAGAKHETKTSPGGHGTAAMADDNSRPWKASAQVLLKEKPAAVWKQVGDPTQWASWNPAISQVQLDSDAATGVALQWTLDKRQIQSTISVLDTEKHFQLDGTYAGPKSSLRFDLYKRDDGTTVVMVVSQAEAGWGSREKTLVTEQLQSFLTALQNLFK